MHEELVPERNDAAGGAKSFAAGRYSVRGLLGEGGQKVVYLVHDSALDRECALSLLKVSNLNVESIHRFQREARAMARLKGNRHIVDVYDVGEDDGAPYLVSEYVSGGDLRGEIRECAGGLAIRRVIGVARDVAAALRAAHNERIVHRDVTPANIWLTDGGQCKLGDFGLAVPAEGAMTASGGLAGTTAYMAPEQALGHACDAQSDLYSLGAVMYEMATGRQPFVGDDPLAVISQHINTAPVAPTWHNPSIPVALEALILALLGKAPDERPRTADAVIDALDALQSLSQDEWTMSAAVNPLERLAGGVFVGRETELGEMRAAVESAFTGKRQLLLLAGEPGIGKTRLSEQLSTYAKLRRASVRWGRCVEGAGAAPYRPWIQILRALAEATDAAALRDEAGADAGRIAQIVPELAPRLGTEVSPAVDTEQARFELFEAISAWLRRTAQREPLVVLLDDLHWVDEPSVRLLQHLAGALRESRVLIVGTYRDAEVGDAHPLMQLIGELPRLGEARQITLRGLSEGDVGSYIELATGQEAPPRLAAAVYRQTEGNALFVTEVVRMRTASGAIDLRNESWTREIPAGVRGVIGRRLGSLSEGCRSVLTAASAIGREFELGVLERVSDAALDAILDALDEAMAAQLVVLAPDSSRRQGQYLFSHALVRDTLYDDLASAKRLRLHARIAAVLEQVYGADPGPRIGAMAHHFREAAAVGDVSKAVQYSIRAGDAARQVFAYEECVRQWDAAIELLSHDGRREEQAELLQRAADVLYLSEPNYGRGIGYLERALGIWERTGNESQQALAHYRLGRIFTSYPEVSDQPRAMRHFRAAIDSLPRDRISSMHVNAWGGLALAQDRMLLIDDALGSARKARTYAIELGRENLTAIPMALEGACLDKKGRVREGIALQDAAWAIGERLNDPIIGFTCAWMRGFREIHYRGDPRGSIALYLRELTKSRLAEAGAQRRQLGGEIGVAYFACGDMRALRACDVNEEERTYFTDDIEGRWERNLEQNLKGREHFRAVGNRLVEGMRTESAGLAFGRLGRLTEAASMYKESVGIYFGRDVGAELCSRTFLTIVEAERGRRDSAIEHLARCDDIVAGREDWRGQTGRIETARAATLACCGDIAGAGPTFERAIELLQQYELVWDQAEALRLWGRALAASGDAAAAMTRYERAIEVYRRIGAGSPWIARIVREYARVSSSGADRTWA